MKKLLVVDGNSIINRAFYGIRPLTTSDGLHTNAIFGMVNILQKHIESVHPDLCAVAFDLKAPTFRHKMYAEYKAGRRAMADELAMQFEPAKKCVAALGFSVISREGYEADDILGTLAEMARAEGDIHTYIVTGDKDSLQLINDSTTVLLETNKGTVTFDRAKFNEVYGLEPEAFIDVKALMGDSSDNIPGVSGIGEKTALKLISEYGSVEQLYAELENSALTQSQKNKLTSGKDSAFLSKELATINCSIPDMPTLSELGNGQIDKSAARDIFARLEFSGFIKRYSLEEDTSEIQNNVEIKEADEKMLASVSAKNIAITFADDNFEIFDGNTVYRYGGAADTVLLLSESHRIICHDCKQLYKHLDSLGVRWRDCAFDIMLAAYVVNSGDNSYELPRLVMEYLGGVISEAIPPSVYIYQLAEILEEKVKVSGQEKLLYDIEMPLASVLADMEEQGFCIDCGGIEQYGKQLSSLAHDLAERIYYHAGGEFNINSPKQLGEILFERLGLPTDKKTKTGYSTNAEILNRLRPYHPIIEDILDYRQVSKLISTYVDGLLKVADSENKVHTNFKQTGTATGRLSSTEPNLQNIPVRTDLGRELRRFFVPKSDDYLLIDADYSQIELRILAAISGDETMIKAFLSGVDIHTDTASVVFNVSPNEVTSDLRKRAKAVNFGIMYGIGEYSLSQDLGISVAQAKRYISSYLAGYPAIDEYLKNTVKQAYEQGYVTTLFGRRRYITELSSQKRPLRAFGERVAMNSPIQGSAADIIKIAMINVDKKLKEAAIDAHLVLQVHDELIVEAHKDCADKAFDILKTEMESAALLSVPMNVEICRGKTWYECK